MKKQKKQKISRKREGEGITLIALVVSIIVLLILAGVSIMMLTGENGLLNQVGNAKTMTYDAQIKENIIMAYNSAAMKKYTEGSTDILADMTEELEKTYGEGNVTITENDGTYIVTINGTEYTFDGETQTGGTGGSAGGDEQTGTSNLTETEKTALADNGIEELTDDEITNSNLKDSENIRAVITGDVPIPTDATYVEGTVDTGVVVEIAGSQFVWVPVPNAIWDGSTTITSGSYTPMAVLQAGSSTNYMGCLYTFSGTTATYQSGYILGTTSYREPDIVSEYDGGSYDSVGITAELLQEEYNAMVESVAKYGGFFVGRYESSISGSTVASVSGVTPMSAASSSGNMWYGMYKLEKEYASSLTSVSSSMIWGSQYDAMLNWALTGADKEKVTATGNASHSYSSAQLTGAEENDVINNIYDLEGNMFEWTLEVSGGSSTANIQYTNKRLEVGKKEFIEYKNNTTIYSVSGSYSNYLVPEVVPYGRVCRGGSCYYSSSPSYRDTGLPYNTSTYNSSRLTLYIK